MTVFKAFLKVLNKSKAPIIMYTVFLIIFAGFSMETGDNTTKFMDEKPSIYIVSEEDTKGINQNLISYMKKNCKFVDLKEKNLEDALFYREVSSIILIPKDFGTEIMKYHTPRVIITSTKDANAKLSELILNRYIQIATAYSRIAKTEDELIEYMNTTLNKKTKVEVLSKLDTTSLNKASSYYNFLNYSLLAGLIYVICLILSSFKEKNLAKRTLVSSMDYKKFNRHLLFSNGLFAMILWVFYILLSIIIVGKVMFTIHGLFYIVNSFIFSCCAVSIAFLIGNLVRNKNAINGIVNVIALGSCFLCGAFVPMEMLPKSVLTIAHILPSYWYIKTNELLKQIETVNIDSITPIIMNMGVVLLFTIGFVIMTNNITKRKQKLD